MPGLSDVTGRALALALEQARSSAAEGGMPFGAALIVDGEIVASARNMQIQSGDFFAHAEMVVLNDWFANNSGMLSGATLVATEAPCVMCAGAAYIAGIRTFVIGEAEHFSGAVTTLESHGATCHVVNDAECIDLVTTFRKTHPELWTRFSAG